MSSFLYAPICPSAFPDPTPHRSSNPNPSPSLCPGFSCEFPAIEHDYMGIGLGLKEAIAQDGASASTTRCSVKNSRPSALISTSADELCGSHLKLAPPTSSMDDDSDCDDANGEGEGLSGNVGWPPISSYRKSTTRSVSTKPPCHTRDIVETLSLEYPQDENEDHIYNASQDYVGNNACSRILIEPATKLPRNSSHIKVSMDGTPIMRKLDLESMQGYQHLSLQLHKLFKFYKRNLICEVGMPSGFKESGDADFVLTYKDKDGDWMFAGTTPWETFARTARRLRIMKKVK